MISPNEKEQKLLLESLWPGFDCSGNGLLSIAEADLAFRRMGGPMIVIYYAKKVQLMAFNAARRAS